MLTNQNISHKLWVNTILIPGTTRGVQEASQITPNLVVRAEAEVPSRISGREKFLGLIEKLAAEVKKNNPDAAILKDKAMVDAFETYSSKEN